MRSGVRRAGWWLAIPGLLLTAAPARAAAGVSPLLAQTTGVNWSAFIWEIALVVVLIAAAIFVICRSSGRT